MILQHFRGSLSKQLRYKRNRKSKANACVTVDASVPTLARSMLSSKAIERRGKKKEEEKNLSKK
jgi:hypothetical protein